MERKKGKTRIRELREARGLSQEQLAQAIGTTNQTISNYETGTTEPDIDAITKLCQFFNVTAGYLLNIEKYNFTN